MVVFFVALYSCMHLSSEPQNSVSPALDPGRTGIEKRNRGVPSSFMNHSVLSCCDVLEILFLLLC